MITINVSQIEELELFKTVIDAGIHYKLSDVPMIDVTLLDLKQLEWKFDRGMRVNRDYIYTKGLQDIVTVRFRYEYVLDGRIVTSYKIHIDYYDLNGLVGLSKTLDRELTGQKLEDFNKVIRTNQILYLRASGKELRKDSESAIDPIVKAQLLAAANLVDELWIRYKDEIIEYENTGNSALANRVSGETQEPYNSVLETIDPETNMKMRDILLYQIT